MIDDIDRRTLMGADKEDAGDRRQPLFWLLWALLIFFVLFGCGQTAMWFDSGGLEDVQVRSGLTVDYGIWTPVAFGGINPLIIAEAAGDNGGVIFLASNPSDSCFLLGCMPNPPTPTPPAGPSATPTITPTNTPTQTETPTSTATLLPLFTFTPTNTLIPSNTPTITNTPTNTPTPTNTLTPTNTPTPTPRVYPVKIANPYKIPPGAAQVTVDFEIMVINWGLGTIPSAELTVICDFLPTDMTYVPGSANQGGTFGPCPDPHGNLIGPAVYWQFSPPLNIAQGSFTLPSFNFKANAKNTIAGQVLTNEVWTWANDIETAVFYRPVYVYTPTPTSTPTGAPTANNDFYSVSEDTLLVISNPTLASPAGGVLGNDVDLLWNDLPDVLEATVTSWPGFGTLNLNLDGTFTYLPDPNYFSPIGPPVVPDTFTYQACDLGGLCDTATVQIQVISVLDAPVANDDLAYSTTEEVPISIPVSAGVLVNDTDGDPFDILTAFMPLQSTPSGGILTFNADGSFFYWPNPDFSGVDTFTYQARDLTFLSSNIATVAITVNPVNDAPVAADDGPYNVAEDSSLTIAAPGVLGNDTDVDNLPGELSASWVSGPSNGSLTLNANGSFQYDPDLDFNGTDTFTYNVCDFEPLCDTGTVTITVNSVNDTPAAVADPSYSVNEDVILVVPAPGVLGNDNGIGDTPLTLTVVAGPSDGGALTLNDDGSFSYTPFANYFGPTTFDYRVTDLDGESSEATVTITVNERNDPPTANDDDDTDGAFVDEDAWVTIDVLANDVDGDPIPDPLTVQSVTDPPNGTVVNNGGDVTYTPDADFNGMDTFQYTVSDGRGGTDTATVTVRVDSVNDTPAAVADPSYSVNEDVILVVPAPGVLGNDNGIGDTPLTLTVVAGPSDGGALTLNDDGSFSYTPFANYFGPTTFDYRVTDLDGESSEATVTITVNERNDPPTANDDDDTDGAFVDEDAWVTIDVLANDVDGDPIPDPLTVQSVTDPPNGTVVNNGGDATYTPDADFNGMDTFQYTVSDGRGGTDTATVTVRVDSVNDTPAAVADPSYSVNEDVILVVPAPGVLGNDNGIGDTPLTLTVVAGPSDGGALTLNGDGSFSYTPFANYFGPTTFDYRVTDLDGEWSEATVTITVNEANDPPTANDDDDTDGAFVDEDAWVTIDVLANDVDGDPIPDPLTVQSVTDPPNGTVVNNGGDVTYTPDADFNGMDTFQYTVSDGRGGTDTATVMVRVDPVNDTPAAVADPSYSVNEDVGLMIPPPGVLGNDTGIGDTPLTLTVIAGPSDGGLLTLNDNGAFGYFPAANYFGPTTFDYRVTDLDGEWSEATVTITVNEVNDPPTANDDDDTDGAFVDEDAWVTIDVLANDVDGDPIPDPLTVQSVTDPPNGTVVNNGGDVTYTPDADFNGMDTFQYTVSDGRGGTDTATVMVRVDSVNDTPAAVADPSYSVNEDVGLMIPPPGVLGNDTGIGDTPLTLTVIAGPSDGGLLTLNDNGAFGYFPAANYFGPTTFDYRVTDLDGEWSEATVTITVNEVNDTPVAVDDPSYSVNEDVILVVPAPGVLGNDNGIGDTPLTLTVVAGPSDGGALTLNDDGSFSYTPFANYFGPTTFDYRVTDLDGESSEATVTITVNERNDPPTANDDDDTDGAFVDEDAWVTIDVLANDVDGDPIPDPLTVQSVTDPPNGTVVNNGGDVTYTPDADFNGMDTFQYTVSDGRGGTDTATVTVRVDSVNDTPAAVADPSYSVNEDVILVVPAPGVLGNDNGIGDTPLTLTVVAGPSDGGALTLNGDGSFSYTPFANYFGPTTFDYRVTDLDGESSEATVTITVNERNDPPTANDDDDTDGAFVDEDAWVTIDVLANDVDGDPIPDPLTVQSVTDPPNGTVVNNGGDVTYTPDADFNGMDTFQYTVSDGRGGTDTATVTVRVDSVNDTPAAVADPSYSVNEDVILVVPAPGVLGNDNGIGDTPLTLTVVAGPSDGGALTLNDDGSFSYTPFANYFGPTTFDYRVTDLDGGWSEATVTITVNPVNDPPVAVTDNYSVDEDTLTPLVVPAPGVLNNDYDVDGDPFSSNLISNVSNGTLALGLDGSFTYMPSSNYNGTDSFTYEICDPSSACSSANVTIVVNPVPDPQMFISMSPSDVTLNPPEVITFDLLFGNRGPGTAYGIVISGAVTGDCTLLTPNPIITSGSMAEGVGLLTTADVQANAPGGACTFTATITSTNGTTASDSAEINGSTSMWVPPSSYAMASTESNGSIEAAIAFLIPVAMLVTPFILSWWGKVKRTPRPR